MSVDDLQLGWISGPSIPYNCEYTTWNPRYITNIYNSQNWENHTNKYLHKFNYLDVFYQTKNVSS